MSWVEVHGHRIEFDCDVNAWCIDSCYRAESLQSAVALCASLDPVIPLRLVDALSEEYLDRNPLKQKEVRI